MQLVRISNVHSGLEDKNNFKATECYWVSPVIDFDYIRKQIKNWTDKYGHVSVQASDPTTNH